MINLNIIKNWKERKRNPLEKSIGGFMIYIQNLIKTVPNKIPKIMEIGTFKREIKLTSSPFAIDKNDENSTSTNISSQDDPARIICGIDLLTPLFSSINFTILGTTTAGDTAARTDPIKSASIALILKKILAKIK